MDGMRKQYLQWYHKLLFREVGENQAEIYLICSFLYFKIHYFISFQNVSPNYVFNFRENYHIAITELTQCSGGDSFHRYSTDTAAKVNEIK
jgi:hypothetical protein